MLDFLLCLEQDRMLLEMCDLEIWLKLCEVIVAVAPADRRERKELSAIGALTDISDNGGNLSKVPDTA